MAILTIRATFVSLAAIALLSGSLACSAGEDAGVAAIIHRLLQAAGTEGSESLESFPGALPPDLPEQPPLYPDARLVVSARQPAPGDDFETAPGAEPGAVARPLLYFIVLDTGDDRAEVFSFYEEALDADPWQLQSSFSTEQLDTLQFFDVEDVDIAGAVSIATGGEDGHTSILISLQDAGAFQEEEPPFELQPSLRLPKEFPPDVPLFDGATVRGTAFFREPGNQSFLLVFLTTSSADEVLDFYREAFQANDWTVQDTGAFGVEDSIDFRDGPGDVQGNVLAQEFARASRYTEVRVQVQLNPAREPAAGATPSATEEDAGDS